MLYAIIDNWEPEKVDLIECGPLEVMKLMASIADNLDCWMYPLYGPYQPGEEPTASERWIIDRFLNENMPRSEITYLAKTDIREMWKDRAFCLDHGLERTAQDIVKAIRIRTLAQ